MSYTFDATSGDTRANLAERVTFNSFSPTRYSEFTKRALNDAVTYICREVGFLEAYEVQAYDTNGIVTQGAQPWFRVDEVWAAGGSVTGTGEKAFMAAAQFELTKADDHVIAQISSSGSPLFYLVRRASSPTGFRPQVDLRILPAGAGGFVAIKGLQSPAVMDADSDVTGLGAEFDSAVVAFAKARCFENEDDTQMAQYWDARCDMDMRKAQEGGPDGDDDSPDTVDGMWDS